MNWRAARVEWKEKCFTWKEKFLNFFIWGLFLVVFYSCMLPKCLFTMFKLDFGLQWVPGSPGIQEPNWVSEIYLRCNHSGLEPALLNLFCSQCKDFRSRAMSCFLRPGFISISYIYSIHLFHFSMQFINGTIQQTCRKTVRAQHWAGEREIPQIFQTFSSFLFLSHK